VNFIIKLLEFTSFDIVMMVIDPMFKRTHFISIYTMVTIEGVTRLLLHNVWKLHSLFTHVILDKRLQFVTYFTKELYCILGIKITSFTVWNP